jgi:ubiquinone/menaquinone biosynthesis C-methylase UbiE
MNANAETIEAWNTVLFDRFLRFRPILATGFGAHGEAVLARHPPREGSQVLDIGCGFGETTVVIAGRVGPRGRAVGIDAAARVIEAATREAEAAAVANVRFAVADAESDSLGGPYDQAFSRFGTMFFANPVAAFRNVGRALVPGAKLTMAVWRKKEENQFFYEVEQRVRAIVAAPPKRENPEKKERDAPAGPGPFSLGNADLASAHLVAAGFIHVTFERFDAEICVGKNVEDAIAFAMAFGPAGEILRLAGEEGERKKPAVAASLRELLAPAARPDGVWGHTTSWIVSAEAP